MEISHLFNYSVHHIKKKKISRKYLKYWNQNEWTYRRVNSYAWFSTYRVWKGMKRSLQSINCLLTPENLNIRIKTETVKKLITQVLLELKFATTFRNISGSPPGVICLPKHSFINTARKQCHWHLVSRSYASYVIQVSIYNEELPSPKFQLNQGWETWEM